MANLSPRSLTSLALLSILLLAPSFSQAATCGQLAGIKGTVEILRMQSRTSGEEAIRHGFKVQRSVEVIQCDDVIQTGPDSSARVILANAKLSLGPDSRIEIAAYSKKESAGTQPVSLLNLTYGKMRALVNKKKSKTDSAAGNKKDPNASFRVRTFSAVVGVRGTDFYTSYEPNSGLTEQATIEGSVDVQQSGTTQKVVVPAGNQVAVETTAAAVNAALERTKKSDKGEESLEPPKQFEPGSEVKKLEVVPIKPVVRDEIKVVSAIVSKDQDFTHTKAVEVLGKPETWVLEKEKVPEQLKGIKNEF